MPPGSGVRTLHPTILFNRGKRVCVCVTEKPKKKNTRDYPKKDNVVTNIYVLLN